MNTDTFKQIGKFLIFKNEVLGYGSLGIVRKAYDLKNKLQPFVVKTINKVSLNNQEIYTLRELLQQRIQKKLSPLILNLINMHETKNQFYLFFEYCEGGSLEEYCLRNQPFSQREAIVIFKKLVQLLWKLNKESIFHENLKPTNILIKDNQFIFADNQLLKLIKSVKMLQNRNNQSIPLYAAPEVLNNENNKTEKSDIYSIGVIIYSMLCKEHPYFNQLNFKKQQKTPKTSKEAQLFISNLNLSQQGSSCLSINGLNNIDRNLKNLITYMVQLDDHRRINWTQLLTHKYFQKNQTKFASPSKSSSITSTSSIQISFSSYSNLSSYLDKLLVLSPYNIIYQTRNPSPHINININNLEEIAKKIKSKNQLDKNISILQETLCKERNTALFYIETYNEFLNINEHLMQALELKISEIAQHYLKKLNSEESLVQLLKSKGFFNSMSFTAQHSTDNKIHEIKKSIIAEASYLYDYLDIYSQKAKLNLIHVQNKTKQSLLQYSYFQLLEQVTKEIKQKIKDQNSSNIIELLKISTDLTSQLQSKFQNNFYQLYDKFSFCQNQ